MDNCMGSGSTGVAAINTGRDFVGFENDHKYFSIAKENIERALMKGRADETADILPTLAK